MADAAGGEGAMPDRRKTSWFVRQITAGTIIQLIAGVIALAIFLFTVGAWKGTQEADNANIKLMIRDLHDSVIRVTDKLDRVSDTVASLDGKVSSLTPARKADLLLPPGFTAIPIGSPP